MTDRRLLLALAAVSPLLVALPLACGAPSDALLAAPLVVLVAPLLAGRYVGERRLLAFAGTDRRDRVARPAAVVLCGAIVRHRPRRWLFAAERAVRPPPVLTALFSR